MVPDRSDACPHVTAVRVRRCASWFTQFLSTNMKLILTLAAFAAVFGTLIAADKAKADADHKAMEDVLMSASKVDREQQTPDYMEEYARRSAEATLRFYSEHPEDPRRWRALAFHTGYVRDVRNHAERHRKHAMELLRAALDMPNVPEGDWETLKSREIKNLSEDVFTAPKEQWAAKLPSMRRAIDELAQRYPNALSLANHEVSYNRFLSEIDPERARREMAKLTQSGNERMRTIAEGRVKVDALRDKPLEMKFTALDGRAVDMKALRGKVVLLDFWATWCGPCVAELPNIQKVYREYHDKGFEVVGVSLDSAEDETTLKEFIRARGVPWPQHFDGKGWKNDFAQEYGVMGIPEQLLFDQDGKLVANRARGEVLEREVKRLLGGG